MGFISGGEAALIGWPTPWWPTMLGGPRGLCRCEAGPPIWWLAPEDPERGGVLTLPGLEADCPIDWLFSESESQSDFFSPFELCVFTCFDKWSLLMKRLLHIGQAKRFSPVCVRKCLCNSSDRVKRFPQNSQLQTNGRSPVCHLRWAFKCDVFP